jgi:arginase
LNQVNPITAGPHLRLVWPQWQGAGTESVRSLAPEFPFDIARRGYSVGTKVLQAVLPEHDGPTAIVPVEMGDIGLEERDGIEAKSVVLQQLRSALAMISEHEPGRITTFGGECSVSMAPFSYLINMHDDDLAILWIDSHPDMGTGETAYPGFHAMVVSALTGHGDQELLEILPATTTADRVALVGMHNWTDPTLPAIADEWGLSVFSPDALRGPPAMPERLLTVQEAGEMLNTGERFPRRLIAERRIRFVRVGRHVRIPESAIAD